MNDMKRLKNDLWRMNFVLFGLLIWVLIEASALWRTGQPSGQTRMTAIECAVPAALFCLLGAASVRSIRKQVLSGSSN
jgi:hypothetical protein